MKKHKISLIAVLMVGMVTMLHAAQFTMDLYRDNGTGKVLTFGMGANADIFPLPPIQAPDELKVAWFEGPGNADETPIIDEDFSKLSIYIKAEADAALWKMYVRDAAKITFKLNGGSIPAGAVLKIYPEGDDSKAVDLADGTVFDAEGNAMYLIDYRVTGSTDVAMAAPTVRRVQMSRSMKSLLIDFDVPEGCSLAGDSAVSAYRSYEEESAVVGPYTAFEALEGDYGTFDAATATLTMTNMTDVARVQFNYWFTKGTASTEKAAVIVDVLDGLMTTLVKKEDAATGQEYKASVIAVDPDEDGYDGTVLTYKVDLDDETLGKALTLKVDTPKFAPTSDAYAVQYSFDDGDYADLPADGAVYTATATPIYIKVKVTLTSKCEKGFVTPSITPADAEEIEMDAVQMLVVSGGTMDIDGNGVITEDDAIMMYNFIALGGIDDPDSMFVDDIIQGIDETQVNAEAALALLKTLAAFLDYDENGIITEDDAIMMYNFIALGGIDDPESMFVDDIIQGIDETQVDAEKALENFKKYASK